MSNNSKSAPSGATKLPQERPSTLQPASMTSPPVTHAVDASILEPFAYISETQCINQSSRRASAGSLHATDATRAPDSRRRDARQGRPRRPDRRVQRVAQNPARESDANQVHHLAPAQRLFARRRHRGRVATETGQARGPRHLRRALHAQRGELRVLRCSRGMS